MGLAHLAGIARSMPPGQVLAKAGRLGLRLIRARLNVLTGRWRCSYAPAGGRLARRMSRLDPASIAPHAAILRDLVPLYRQHRFNLLGSGWVRVAHGETYAGFGSWRYGPGPALGNDWRTAVAAQAWPGNRARASALLALITDPAYQPIDWQVDFKSGYRWSPRHWGPSSPYGHRPGVDIKLPWELARLRHLPHLALAFAHDHDPALPAEFRHQVLDFLAANPPGWGVNWACAMDVAIRAATILLARDLFLAAGAVFDDGFEDAATAAMRAHGRFILGHLEWSETHRGNHYLADICGLAFIAAYLPGDDETDLWLALAIHAVATEIPRQFAEDGSNFEASTAYHRLSAEMALFTTALILGLPVSRQRALAGVNPRRRTRRPNLPPQPLAWPPFPPATLERLARAIRFAEDITAPSGNALQIGDNDSGRFLAPGPLFDLGPAGPVERNLDFSDVIAAAAGLFDPATTLAAQVVAALAGGVRVIRPACPPAATAQGERPGGTAQRLVRLRLVPPDPTALLGLMPMAYPDFGLYLWRNDRTLIAFRCGPIGQNGQGGHAHNDQLAVTLEIDGIAWAKDPGTFVYTPDLTARNRYRSALAHFVPRHGESEPARFLAPFRLEDRAQARIIRFDGDGMAGWHQGFGAPVLRRLWCEDGAVVVEDCFGGERVGAATMVEEHVVTSPEALAKLWGLTLPVSPAYGVIAE